MSVIITGIDIQENCAFCPARETGISKSYCNNLLGKRIDIDLIDLDKTKPTWCPLKSIDGLIDFIKEHSYPIRYGTNSIEQGMTITGIEQAIKEYCGEDGETE